MAMRINHNIAALNALRNLNKTNDELSTSLERLSSGQKVNRAADGPAALVISEQMRGQIASVNQAIRNSEASVSMVQTAEASLNEVNTLLVSIRQLAIHAANEGANDKKMLAADQAEAENALDTIDRIARTSQFGTRTLLDGSNGANGVAVGEGLEFMDASPTTQSSPGEGYAVNISRAPTRAEKHGERAISLDDLRDKDTGTIKPFTITIEEGGKPITFDLSNESDGGAIRKTLQNMKDHPDQFDDPARVIRNFQKVIAQVLDSKAKKAGLNVDVFIQPPAQEPNLKDQLVGGGGESKPGTGMLRVRHTEFGSKSTFFVSSSVPGILSDSVGKFEKANPGLDVEGTIDGKVGIGEGELLRGADHTATEGLVVRFSGIKTRVQTVPSAESKALDEMEAPSDYQDGARAISRKETKDGFEYTWEVPVGKNDIKKQPADGFVHVSQNALAFQVGPTRGQQVRISLVDAKTDRLGTGIKNASGYRSLREINLTSSQGAQDAILLVDESIKGISSVRANLGAFQKNTLQSNTNSLRIAHENLSSAESSLRDADMAEEMSHFTRNQIMMQSGIAMLAQANQTPQSVLQLLNNRAA